MPVVALSAIALPLIVLMAVLLVSSCGSRPIDAEHAVSRPPVQADLLKSSLLKSSTGCQFAYTRYQPNQRLGRVTLILGHGFLRDQTNMAGLARSVAAVGVPVVTMNFCNMSFLNGNHTLNAADMVALSKHLAIRKPLYAGFSAGALAALIAGAQDPQATAVLTLDLVDDGDLGIAAMRRLKAPVYGFAGRPSACNRQAAAVSLYDDFEGGSVVSFAAASHCEFETPSDWICRLLCGDADSAAQNSVTRQLIVDAVTARVKLINQAH